MNLTTILIVFGLLVIYIIISIFTKQDYEKKYNDSIKTLYRQSARWALASIQDDSELIRNLHANYATGYLWALKDIISSEEFKKITGEDFMKFESKIVSVQDEAAKKLVERCKDLVYTDDPTILRAVYLKAE